MRTNDIFLFLVVFAFFVCPSQVPANTVNRGNFLDENKGSVTRALPNHS